MRKQTNTTIKCQNCKTITAKICKKINEIEMMNLCAYCAIKGVVC